MRITQLDNQLFKNIGSDKADPKNNLDLAVNSITTDNMPLSDSIRFTPSLEDCLKEVDKAVTAHCDTGTKKTDIGLFPIPILDKVFKFKKGFGADPEYRVVNYFSNMDTLHNEGRKIAELPWGYKEKRDKFFEAVNEMDHGGSAKKEALNALKTFLGAVAAAAVCLLSYLVVDGRLEDLLDHLDGGGFLIGLLLIFVNFVLRFGGWFVMIIAGLAALILLGSGFITLIGGLVTNDKKDRRKQLANTYVDVMRFIRVRILWCQGVHGTESVPMFLAEAEKEILQRAQCVRKHLKQQLGSNWLATPQKYRIIRFKHRSESNIIPHEIDPKVKELMEDDSFTPRLTEIEAANYLAVSAQKLGRVVEAIAWFRIAADAGSAHGAWAAAQLCLTGLKAKWEQPQFFAKVKEDRFPAINAFYDLAEAERLARRAKELGHAMADVLLEEIWLKQAHIYGERAEDAMHKLRVKLLDEKKSDEEAFVLSWQDETVQTLYAKAGRAHRALSDIGHGYSTYWIAVYLCQSASTVDEVLEACHWIKALSTSGHEYANLVQSWYSQPMNSLAIRFNKEGRREDAGKIFLALANAGVGQGMFNMAIYYSGQRGKIDDAIHWARKALAKGEPNSEMLLKKLESQKKFL